jgi:hypothetical protein
VAWGSRGSGASAHIKFNRPAGSLSRNRFVAQQIVLCRRGPAGRTDFKGRPAGWRPSTTRRSPTGMNWHGRTSRGLGGHSRNRAISSRVVVVVVVVVLVLCCPFRQPSCVVRKDRFRPAGVGKKQAPSSVVTHPNALATISTGQLWRRRRAAQREARRRS